jgi:hypothetical protein
MSKILSATCNSSGKVTADGVEVVGAIVLSEGKQASSGVAVLDGDKVWYLTSSATDIKTTIEKLSDSLTKIGNMLTAIGAGMTGPTTAPPPTLAADVTALNAVVTELNALKDGLK